MNKPQFIDHIRDVVRRFDLGDLEQNDFIHAIAEAVVLHLDAEYQAEQAARIKKELAESACTICGFNHGKGETCDAA